MRTELPTLYKKDTTGKIRQWTIIAEDNKFWTEQGTVGGKIVVNKPTITFPKNLDPGARNLWGGSQSKVDNKTVW